MTPITLREALAHDEGFQMQTPNWLQHGFYNGRVTFSARQCVERLPFITGSRSLSCMPSADRPSTKAAS